MKQLSIKQKLLNEMPYWYLQLLLSLKGDVLHEYLVNTESTVIKYLSYCNVEPTIKCIFNSKDITGSSFSWSYCNIPHGSYRYKQSYWSRIRNLELDARIKSRNNDKKKT